MTDFFLGTAKPHPAQAENRSLAHSGRLIALSVLAGLLLSAIAAVAIWAILIQKTATPGDLQLLLPLALLAVPIFLWQAHRHFAARPRLRITAERIEILPRGLSPLTPAKRVDASAVQSAHILRDAPGARLVLVRKNASSVELDLLWNAAPHILEWLMRHGISVHDGPREIAVANLLCAWIPPAEWKTASDEQRLVFSWNFNLPFLFGRMLARQPVASAADLERFYRLLRTWADFLFLHEAAADVAQCLPDFVLPLEDRLRIACVLRVPGEVESALRALAKVGNHEEIPAAQLEDWRAQLKYRNLPPPPYSSVGARLLSGVSHYARLREDGTLETRDGSVSLGTFVAARLPQRAFNTAPLELHDILGRTSRVNQDEAETLCDIRRAAPHILYIHAQSYISFQARMQLKKILRAFRKSKEN